MSDEIISKILVAVDGSKPSLDASNQAIDLAKKLGAELTVLYVVSPDARYSYLEDTVTPRFPEPLKAILKMAMERGYNHVDKVKQNATKNNIRVKTDVIIGITSVVKEIVEYAKEKKMDLIVIGSRGMSGFKNFSITVETPRANPYREKINPKKIEILNGNTEKLVNILSHNEISFFMV